jgi:mycothiol S-conjugate amidase
VLEVRDAALRAHASQVAPDSAFFFWPNDILRTAWPTEDFQLIDSKVETDMPETDLFAGIAPEPDASAPDVSAPDASQPDAPGADEPGAEVRA